MASFEFGTGVRSQKLAGFVKKHNYDVKVTHSQSEVGAKCISQIDAPCITITRDMIVKSYYSEKPEYEASVDMWLDHFALNAKGKVISHTRDKVIICDDDGDKAMSLRFKSNHQMDVARLSEKLGISRNDFVIRAIEHYVKYLTSIEEMEE